MMNQFIEEYIEKLRRIASDEDIIGLYHWFWNHQEEIQSTTDLMNLELGLQDTKKLQPDLPCLTVGSRSGLVVLAANPGWSPDINKIENEYCKKSPGHYVDLMLNFFQEYPRQVGPRLRWWSNIFSFIELLPNGPERFGSADSSVQRWERAHESKIIGGWELFPFHSDKDGVSAYMTNTDWLRSCAQESISAALRLEPEVILIASKSGWKMARDDLLKDCSWQDTEIPNFKSLTSVSYSSIAGRRGRTEIIAISYQLFSARRTFTNRKLLDVVNQLRDGSKA
jgi:hypothetical protein